MRVITESGSIYEIDREKKKIRKLSQQATTESKRITNEWKSFNVISDIVIGQAMVIFWNQDEPVIDGMNAAFTTTNVVVSVSEEIQPALN